jgi:hypothetical protein
MSYKNAATAVESNISDSHNSRVVHEFIVITKRLFGQVKQPGFKLGDWAPLAELVAVGEFEWGGPFGEVLNWQEHIEFLTKWAHTVSWKSTLRRVHEWQGVVYLEHEEQTIESDAVEITPALTVFEFNKAGKIRHIDVYLQRKPSLGL